MFVPSRFARFVTTPVVAGAFCLSLAGCQTAGPGASLAMDASDPCGGERSAFANSKTYFQDKLVSSAATGALIGGGLGALGALASGGRSAGQILAGAAIGAAVGGIAGAGTAYYNSLYEKAQDQAEVANYMNRDLAREGQEIDRTVATFARLRACRFGQANFVKDQVRARSLDRPTGLARIGYHRDKFNEEIGIARQFGVSMANRNRQFQDAANALRSPPPVQSSSSGGTFAQRPVSRPATATRAAPQQVATVNRAATVSVPEKRASFDNTVAAAERSSKAAFDIDSTAKLSWRSFIWADA